MPYSAQSEQQGWDQGDDEADRGDVAHEPCQDSPQDSVIHADNPQQHRVAHPNQEIHSSQDG